MNIGSRIKRSLCYTVLFLNISAVVVHFHWRYFNTRIKASNVVNTLADSQTVRKAMLNYTIFAENIVRDLKRTTVPDALDRTLDEIKNFRWMFNNVGPSGHLFKDETELDFKREDVVGPDLSSTDSTHNMSRTHDIRSELLSRYENSFYKHFPDFLRRRLETLRMNKTNAQEANKELATAVEKMKTASRTFKHEFVKAQISRSKTGSWKRTKCLEVQQQLWAFLKQTQDPTKCNSTKTLTCWHNVGTGFGSFVHRNVFCLAAAVFSRRTLLVDEISYNTYFERHTDAYFSFKHLTDVHCSKRKSIPISSDLDFAKHSSLEDVSLRAGNSGIVDPLEIPEQFAHELSVFHSYPPALWVALLSKMFMKETDVFETHLLKSMQIMKFTSPIVGVHVRRTDKVGREARFHALSEYMYHVANWYDAYTAVHGSTQRTVFLASDSPDVFGEAVKEYPDYTFIFNNKTLSTDARVDLKGTEELQGIILEINLLSRCDFLVCTMSSNVCRLAYEWLQLHQGDASDSVESVDIDYFFYPSTQRMFTAIVSHAFPHKGEIAFKEGDVILMTSGNWRAKIEPGFLIGRNRRTGGKGLVPRFKVVEIIKQRVIG